MEPNDSGLLIILKVTANGIAHAIMKSGEIICFGEDGFSQSTRRVSAVGRFFYQEHQLSR